MAYEKQFWEQPHHDSSEEERLEREKELIETLKLARNILSQKYGYDSLEYFDSVINKS